MTTGAVLENLVGVDADVEVFASASRLLAAVNSNVRARFTATNAPEDANVSVTAI